MIASLLVAVMVTLKRAQRFVTMAIRSTQMLVLTAPCHDVVMVLFAPMWAKGLQATKPATMGISQTPTRAQALAQKRSAVMGSSVRIFNLVELATKLVMTTMESKRMLV